MNFEFNRNIAEWYNKSLLEYEGERYLAQSHYVGIEHISTN